MDVDLQKCYCDQGVDKIEDQPDVDVFQVVRGKAVACKEVKTIMMVKLAPMTA